MKFEVKSCSVLWLLAVLFVAGRVFAEPNDVLLRIDHAGPITWDRIKIAGDHFYVYQRSMGKLAAYNSQGELSFEFRFNAHSDLQQRLLPAEDFAVAPGGTVFFTGRTRSGGLYVISRQASGQIESLESDERLEVRKIAASPQGDPLLLGWREGILESVRGSGKAAAAGLSLIHRCDPDSGALRSFSGFSFPAHPKSAKMAAWSLDMTPFAVDLQGNAYFATSDRNLFVFSGKGSYRTQPIPRAKEEIQIVQNILPHPHGGVLVAVVEGANQASEKDKAAGHVMLYKANKRVFALGREGFQELYSGRELRNLVGILSDGAWVSANKRRGSIELSRFEH